MSKLKKLAGQTLWYGLSNVGARLLTSLMTPYLTYMMIGDKGKEEYGMYSFIYLLFPFLNVIYTYGMETSFFRFSNKLDNKEELYRNQSTSMLISTLFFTLLICLFQDPIALFAELGAKKEYVLWCALILALDALAVLPFAKLRLENRPRKYALIKITSIIVYVLTVVLLFSFGEKLFEHNAFLSSWYQKHWGLGFILFANIIQSIFTIIVLFNEWKTVRLAWNQSLMKQVLLYGLPILIAGFAGTINDTLNRVMYMKLYPASDVENKIQLGVFSAIVRLTILIQLAVQAFKMAAEPFFFSIAKDKDAQENYGNIMKWFCLCLFLMFLNITLFIDLWQYFVGPEYRTALYLTPILLLSHIFLGVYYNLSIWYKLTDKTSYGAYIMIIGATITLLFNFYYIPRIGYDANAWSMMLSNLVMLLVSYFLGQKYYPVPYPVKSIGFYFALMLLFAGIQGLLIQQGIGLTLRISIGVVLFCIYVFIIWKKDLQQVIVKRKLG